MSKSKIDYVRSSATRSDYSPKEMERWGTVRSVSVVVVVVRDDNCLVFKRVRARAAKAGWRE